MKKDKKEHLYWGRSACTYDAATAYIVGKETQHETARWLSNQFKDTDEVLELGCGTGHFSEVIAEKVMHLTATDGALEMLERFEERLGPLRNVTLKMEDCYCTDFADGLFDAVFLGNVAHILAHPIDVLSEGRRILKPGGMIVLVDSTSCGMPFWSKLAMGSRYLRKFGLPPRENRIVSMDDVSRWLEAAGFLVEESRLIQKETNVVCVRGRKKT